MLKRSACIWKTSTPGYKFAPAILVFCDVTALALDVDLTEGIRISQAIIARQTTGYCLEVALNIGYGQSSRNLSATFQSLKLISERM